MRSSSDKGENLAKAAELVARAAGAGAGIVVLPEKWNAFGSPETFRQNAEPLDGGQTVRAMAEWSRRHRITLVGGSISEFREGRDRISNTSVIFHPNGEIAAVYRKLHMFDVDVAGLEYRESRDEEPGTDVVTLDVGEWRLAPTICYDLRFPELYRVLALQGATLVTVSAAFTLHTGKDHWELLLRARAVENQCFVAAAAQWGEALQGRPTFGRSMIVDPWGVVLAQAADADTVIVSDIDLDVMASIRASLPSLANRRPEMYAALRPNTGMADEPTS
jgi:deaminated glutathione amidase